MEQRAADGEGFKKAIRDDKKGKLMEKVANKGAAVRIDS